MRTSHTGIGFITTIMACLILGSCQPPSDSSPESAGCEEFAPTGTTLICAEEEDEEELSLPQLCRHLYNVGRSREWQDCMGVGPK